MCEHEFAYDLGSGGLDIYCVVVFEASGEHAVKTTLLDGAGSAFEDGGAVGGEDVGHDVEGFDLEDIVTFIEAVGEESEVFFGEGLLYRLVIFQTKEGGRTYAI